MTEAKLAPNLPGWMLEHANRYLSSGGTEGHMHKPGRPDMTYQRKTEREIPVVVLDPIR
jgi:hypothetical protein